MTIPSFHFCCTFSSCVLFSTKNCFVHSFHFISNTYRWLCSVIVTLSWYLYIPFIALESWIIFNCSDLHLWKGMSLPEHQLFLVSSDFYAESLFVLRFYGPVNPMGSCRAWSVYHWTTRIPSESSPANSLCYNFI